MPTVIKTPDRYKCNVCGDDYDTEALAFACEDRPSRETTEHERAVVKARSELRFSMPLRMSRHPPPTSEELAAAAAELTADAKKPPWLRRSWLDRFLCRSSINDRDHIDHIESLRIGADESEEPRTLRFGESMDTDTTPTIGSEVMRVVNEESAG